MPDPQRRRAPRSGTQQALHRRAPDARLPEAPSADRPERFAADRVLPPRSPRAGDGADPIARAIPALPAMRSPPRRRYRPDGDPRQAATQHADALREVASLARHGTETPVRPWPRTSIVVHRSRSRSDRAAGTDRPRGPLRAGPA